MKRLFILITFSCLLFLQGSFAQVDLQAPLPQDPNIVTGKQRYSVLPASQ